MARVLVALVSTAAAGAAIDRQAVVSRHSVVITAANASGLDPDHSVLSLGNGAFAFNADVTGLQTFNTTYSNTGTGTFADWGWHISPWNETDPSYAVDAFVWPYYDTPTDGHGGTRKVPYANSGPSPPAVTDWLMSNPHRANLVQLSLRAWGGGASTAPLQLLQLSAMSQRLDVWAAALESNFSVAPAGPMTCAMTPDNNVVQFECGPGGGVITSVPWASYGQPSGSCATGFAIDPACASSNSSAVLASLCVGRPSCRCVCAFSCGCMSIPAQRRSSPLLPSAAYS